MCRGRSRRRSLGWGSGRSLGRSRVGVVVGFVREDLVGDSGRNLVRRLLRGRCRSFARISGQTSCWSVGESMPEL
jgi:hypothetical protein